MNTASGGDFFEGEIGQAADLTRGDEPAATVPAANRRDFHAHQAGQHRRRVKLLGVVFALDEAKLLPELRLANDRERASFVGGARGEIELVGRCPRIGRRVLLAEHQKRGRGVRSVGERCAGLADQPLGFAARHAGQAADERDPLAGQRAGRRIGTALHISACLLHGILARKNAKGLKGTPGGVVWQTGCGKSNEGGLVVALVAMGALAARPRVTERCEQVGLCD